LFKCLAVSIRETANSTVGTTLNLTFDLNKNEENRNDMMPRIRAILLLFALCLERAWGFLGAKLIRVSKNTKRMATVPVHSTISPFRESVESVVRTSRDRRVRQEIQTTRDMDAKSLTRLINALAESRDPRASERAHQILKIMLSHSSEVQANVIHCNSVIKTCSRGRSRQAAQRADKVLAEMWQLYALGNIHVKPNTISYNTVIHAWGNSGCDSAADRATALLQDMWSRRDQEVKPNVRTYCAVMNALSQCRDKGEEAEIVLRDMTLRHALGDKDLAPNLIAFNSAINAWSNTCDSSSGDRASGLLKQLWALYVKTDDLSLKPDITTYNSILKIWATRKGRTAAKKATKMLHELWATYNERGDKRLKPNCITYSTVIKSWANSGSSNAGEKASALLEEMWTHSKAGDPALIPDQKAYGSVLNAWANNENTMAGEKASSILAELWELYQLGHRSLQPDKTSYNTVIRAWRHSHVGDESAIKALALVEDMWQHYMDGARFLKPDAKTYSTAISTISGSGAPPELCHAVLRDQWKKYHEDGDESLKPDAICYTNVIHAYASSGNAQAPAEATALLREMQGHYANGHFGLKPDRITYLTAIRAHEEIKNSGAEAIIASLTREMKSVGL
jgi:hypothetical protein